MTRDAENVSGDRDVYFSSSPALWVPLFVSGYDPEGSILAVGVWHMKEVQGASSFSGVGEYVEEMSVRAAVPKQDSPMAS